MILLSKYSADRKITILLMLILCLATCVLSDYYLYRITLVAVSAIVILGLNLLIGLSGQFSIGHGAFYALGAYTVGIGSQTFGLSPYFTIGLSGIIGFFMGCLFGWPSLRLESIHLVLATWALAVCVPQLLKSRHFETWTGGVQGIYVDRPGAPFNLPLSDDQWWHIVTLLVLTIGLTIAFNITDSRTGRALGAIRDNPLSAAPMGVNIAYYKTTIFGISAAYAGIAGALAALIVDFIAPDTFTLNFSILLFTGAIIGGVRSVWGALLGGALIQFLPGLAVDASGIISFPSLGVILLLMVYLFPKGIAGRITDLRWK